MTNLKTLFYKCLLHRYLQIEQYTLHTLQQYTLDSSPNARVERRKIE